MSRHWHASRELQAFIDAVEDKVPIEDRDELFYEWLHLARFYARELDPLLSIEKAKRLLTNPDEQSWYSDQTSSCTKTRSILTSSASSACEESA